MPIITTHVGYVFRAYIPIHGCRVVSLTAATARDERSCYGGIKFKEDRGVRGERGGDGPAPRTRRLQPRRAFCYKSLITFYYLSENFAPESYVICIRVVFLTPSKESLALYVTFLRVRLRAAEKG